MPIATIKRVRSLATLGDLRDAGRIAHAPTICLAARNGNRRRRRVSAAYQRQHRTLERPTEGALGRFFDSLSTLILRRLKSSGPSAIAEELFEPSEHLVTFNSTMSRHWGASFTGGVAFERDWIESAAELQSYSSPIIQANEPPSFDVPLSESLRKSNDAWLSSRKSGVWSRVGNTTRKVLAATLNRGIIAGDNFDELQSRVQGTLKSYKGWQSRRVARTETTGTMNFGQMQERIEAGIEHKEWVSTIDARNRGASPKSPFNHLAPDGQIRRNQEPFIVSGQRLLFPADGSMGASSGNLINCRCSAVAGFPETKPSRPSRSRPAG